MYAEIIKVDKGDWLISIGCFVVVLPFCLLVIYLFLKILKELLALV